MFVIVEQMFCVGKSSCLVNLANNWKHYLFLSVANNPEIYKRGALTRCAKFSSKKYVEKIFNFIREDLAT